MSGAPHPIASARGADVVQLARVVVSLARVALAHCPDRLGHSEHWHRDAAAEWRVCRAPCEACRAIAALLGLESEPVAPDVAAEQG